jgi:hypothetical protein
VVVGEVVKMEVMEVMVWEELEVVETLVLTLLTDQTEELIKAGAEEVEVLIPQLEERVALAL